MAENFDTIILGGGMTGLAAGMASGLPVFEAATDPGGICSSYYVRPGEKERLPEAPADGEAYRFEIGGGHWIFGGDPVILRFIRETAPVKSYARKSSVYFHERDGGTYVPYPLQNNLRYLPEDLRARALSEMSGKPGVIRTMDDWYRAYFGEALSELFFTPFHQLYTANFQNEIAPQDAYKSPVNLAAAIQGAFGDPPDAGYNVTFVYPEEGLNTLARRMAEKCNIHYGKRVTRIDAAAKQVHCADGSVTGYKNLISTLPLNRMLEMTDTKLGQDPDPCTSVLVLNIGAEKGAKCPDDNWLYNPDAKSGFHRVGFYSNVDVSFLPKSSRNPASRVSIYVERAYREGEKPSPEAIDAYCKDTVKELTDWGYIKNAEVVDPTWIDEAYTWTRPGSTWRGAGLKALEEKEIFQVGRYARWVFQGIADSIRDGFQAGSAFKP